MCVYHFLLFCDLWLCVCISFVCIYYVDVVGMCGGFRGTGAALRVHVPACVFVINVCCFVICGCVLGR